MIELSSLTKKYGSNIAVNSLSLSIPEGELFVLVGPNGAGKTTTIKMMAGLIEPDSGDIRVGPYNLKKEPIKAKKIVGYIPDRPFLYPKLTANEFLEFVGMLYGIPINIINKRRKILFNLFELEERADELIENYSHGMRQRLAIIGALIHSPSILLIDEPFIGLDPYAGRLVIDLLKELKKKGVTIFLSTHVLKLAEELADRIGIIHKGKLLAKGTLEEISRLSLSKTKNLEEIFITITEQKAPSLLIKKILEEF